MRDTKAGKKESQKMSGETEKSKVKSEKIEIKIEKRKENGLKKEGLKIEEKLTAIFQVLATALFFFLFVLSFLRTGTFSPDISDEKVYFVRDSVPKNLLSLGIVLLCSVLLCMGIKKLEAKRKLNMNLVALAASVLVAVLGIYWINAAQIAPIADQYYICQYASEFNEGDFSGLEKGGYVGIYQYQLGLISLMRILFSLFGDGSYWAYQYLSAILTALIVWSGYRIVRLLTQDNHQAELFYLLLSVGCYPMYGYVTFVYGEITYVAFAMLAAWQLLENLREFRWWRLVVLVLSVGAAVLMRKNMLIIIIAFLIILFIKTIQKPDWHLAASAAAILAGWLLSGLLMDAVYHPYIPEDSKSMPSILFIAEGFNEDGLAGWFNDYSMTTYRKYDCEPEAASENAKLVIEAFLRKCINQPAFAVKFFYEKLGSQWNAPMYHVLQMNEKVVGEQKKIARDLYTGKTVAAVEAYMNVYQFVVYGAVLFVLIARRREWKQVSFYVLLIAVFGGFLFSIMWEAKTRYVVPYLFLMLPYAGIGLADCSGKIAGQLQSRKRS